MRRRVLVDVQGPTCPKKKAQEILEAFQAAVVRSGLASEVEVVGRGCFGLCRMAPNLYIEPEGVWYSKLKLEDVNEIVEKHLRGGQIVDRLVYYNPNVAGDRAGRGACDDSPDCT